MRGSDKHNFQHLPRFTISLLFIFDMILTCVEKIEKKPTRIEERKQALVLQSNDPAHSTDHPMASLSSSYVRDPRGVVRGTGRLSRPNITQSLDLFN
jgi:hypothetical protein